MNTMSMSILECIKSIEEEVSRLKEIVLNEPEEQTQEANAEDLTLTFEELGDRLNKWNSQIETGDYVAVIDEDGVIKDGVGWVFKNVGNPEFVIKYAYGKDISQSIFINRDKDGDMLNGATDKAFVVITYDKNKEYYYLLDEEEDECFVVRGDCIAKTIREGGISDFVDMLFSKLDSDGDEADE